MGNDAGCLVQPVILDNTVLTNLALINRTDLVLHLWPGIVCTTPSVMDEYQAGVDGQLVPDDTWTEIPIILLTDEEMSLAASFVNRLGAGERSCLAVAVCRQGLFATDDLDARRLARQKGVPLTGSIGILTLCVRRGHLSLNEANILLSQMIAFGYRSPINNLDDVI